GASGTDGDHVGIPTEEHGAPPSPHEGHFRIAILRDHDVVKDARAVELQPPPGILVDQFLPRVGPALANEHVSDVGHITAGVRLAAAHFHSFDDAGCPCWTCVFPSKPKRNAHREYSDGQNRTLPAP